jgi:hypothetical protein
MLSHLIPQVHHRPQLEAAKCRHEPLVAYLANTDSNEVELIADDR